VGEGLVGERDARRCPVVESRTVLAPRPHDARKAAAVIHHGEPRLVDVLKVRYTRMDGSNALRYSINITSFGMGGAVAARANRS
jgi:diacylglycerol kinase family enzyme